MCEAVLRERGVHGTEANASWASRAGDHVRDPLLVVAGVRAADHGPAGGRAAFFLGALAHGLTCATGA